MTDQPKARRKRRKPVMPVIKPVILLRPKGLPSILNRAAREALAPNGELYIIAFQQDGSLCFRSFDMDGLVSVAPINDFSSGRGQVSLWIDMSGTRRVSLEWNAERNYFQAATVVGRYVRARAGLGARVIGAQPQLEARLAPETTEPHGLSAPAKLWYCPCCSQLQGAWLTSEQRDEHMIENHPGIALPHGSGLIEKHDMRPMEASE